MSPSEQAASQTATTTQAQEPNLLDAVLDATKTERPRAEELLKAVIDEALQGTVTFDKNVTKSIKEGMARIDAAISKQLAAIMHHADFQRLEGSWRGLHYLVMNSETNAQLKLKVLNISKKELFKDVEKAVEFDHSQIF